MLNIKCIGSPEAPTTPANLDNGALPGMFRPEKAKIDKILPKYVYLLKLDVRRIPRKLRSRRIRCAIRQQLIQKVASYFGVRREKLGKNMLQFNTHDMTSQEPSYWCHSTSMEIVGNDDIYDCGHSHTVMRLTKR